MYEMCAGKPPFHAQNQAQLLMKITQGHPHQRQDPQTINVRWVFSQNTACWEVGGHGASYLLNLLFSVAIIALLCGMPTTFRGRGPSATPVARCGLGQAVLTHEICLPASSLHLLVPYLAVCCVPKNGSVRRACP
eukprot:1778949-Amphidinium_carterae.1